MNEALWLETLVGIVAFWLTVSVLWKGHRIDVFRQRLFTIRGRLLLMVADGRLSADDKAYTFLRLTINGMINRAEHFNFIFWLFAIFVKSPSPSTPLQEWEDAVKKLPTETQCEMKELDLELLYAFGSYLISGSILMFSFASLYTVYKMLRLFGNATSAKLTMSLAQKAVQNAAEKAAKTAQIRRYENDAYHCAEVASSPAMACMA